MIRLRSLLITAILIVFAPSLQSKPEEQAVIVHAPLSDTKFGSKEDFAHYTSLEGKLRAAIEDAKFGEYDGNEVGQGEFVFYMYASDADRLFRIVEPILRADKKASQGYAIVRYGPPGAKNRKIDLAAPEKRTNQALEPTRTSVTKKDARPSRQSLPEDLPTPR